MFLLSALASVLLLALSWKLADRRAASYWAAFLALLPLAFFSIILPWSLASPQSMGDAFGAVILLAIGGTLPVSALYAGLWSVVVHRSNAFALATGAAFGFVLAPFAYVALDPPFGYSQLPLTVFLMFCLLITAFGAVVLGAVYALVEVEFGRPSDPPVRLVRGSVLLLLVCCLGASAFFFPNAAFRVREVPDALEWAVRLGAKRALSGSEPAASYAERYLAERGDPVLAERVRADLESGASDPRLPYPAEALSRSRPSDPAVTATLRKALEAELDRYVVDNSFGHEETRIETLCRLLGERRDAEAVPLLERAFRIHPTYMNFRETSGVALSLIPGEKADHACASALASLHPNLHRQLIGKLARHPGPRTAEAAKRKRAEDEKWRADRAAREADVDDLIARHDVKALRDRANTGHAYDRATAAIALVRARDSKREKAVWDALPAIAFRGAELRGWSDAELVKGLGRRARENAHLYRFLGDWSPPEAVPYLREALVKFNMGEAAIGLGRIGNREATDVLIRHWRAQREDTGFEAQLLVAMSLTDDPRATDVLKVVARRKPMRPALISDGGEVYAHDVAAACLARKRVPAEAPSKVAVRWIDFVLR